jgi:hypothetical protein
MPRIAKRLMFSKICNTVSVQLRLGASAGTAKSIKIKFRPSASFIDLAHLRFISY